MKELTSQTIGNYFLTHKLTSDNITATYAAEHKHDPVRGRVMVEVLAPEAIVDQAKALQHFEQKAALYQKLRHPHIMRCLEFGEEQSSPFLVFDYWEGGALADLIAQPEALGWSQSVGILRQIGEALDHAHRQGILHGNIQPDNIFFDDEGNAYLGGFGATPALNVEAAEAIDTPPTAYHYLSPEQLRNETIDARSDLFALAVVFYQMISGHLPFAANDTALLKHQILKEAPALLPADLWLPPGITTVLQQALEKSPQRRQKSVLAFVEAIEALDLERTDSERERQPAWPWARLGIAAAGIAVIAVAAIILGPRVFEGAETQAPPPATVSVIAQSSLPYTPASEPAETPTPVPTAAQITIVATPDDGDLIPPPPMPIHQKQRPP